MEDECRKLWPYINVQACIYNLSYNFPFADNSKAINKIARWGSCMDVSCNNIKFLMLQIPCYIIQTKSGLLNVSYITNRKKKHICRRCPLSVYRIIQVQQLAWYTGTSSIFLLTEPCGSGTYLLLDCCPPRHQLSSCCYLVLESWTQISVWCTHTVNCSSRAERPQID